MFGGIRIAGFLIGLVYLGIALAVWKLWLPVGDIQVVAFWVIEVILTVLGAQSLIISLAMGKIKKNFSDTKFPRL